MKNYQKTKYPQKLLLMSMTFCLFKSNHLVVKSLFYFHVSMNPRCQFDALFRKMLHNIELFASIVKLFFWIYFYPDWIEFSFLSAYQAFHQQLLSIGQKVFIFILMTLKIPGYDSRRKLDKC